MVKELVKGKLAWPVDKCECGYDLREAIPKANEKANDASGRLTWNDFCPRCGHGYQVGLRLVPALPADELARQEAEKVVAKVAPAEVFADVDPEHQITPGPVAVGEASGIPPDKRAKMLVNKSEPQSEESGIIDPENQLGVEPESPGVDEAHAPREGQYWCTKCASMHNQTSKVGGRHKKYAE